MYSVAAPSKTLIKLIDLSVVPASLIIFVKIISLLILNAALNLSWNVATFSDAFFGIHLTYISQDDLNLVVSYSNLFMHIAALVGTALAISKLFYLHPHHVRPSVVLTLAKKDKLHYINSAFHLYYESIVWGIFLLVSDALIVFDYMQGITYSWVLFFAAVSTLTVLFIIVRSIDRDILSKNFKVK